MSPKKRSQTPSTSTAPGQSRRGTTQTNIGRPSFLSDGEKGTRLQKFLAVAGVDSRRHCEDFIRDGRVTVDGEVVTNPAVSVQPDEQDVRLDGERLRMPRYRYYLLNKPKGVVCTNNDPAGRPRAVDLCPNMDQRLFTVGRLDENTEGLLLVTNDGALAEHLAHPRYEVVRRYRVQVAGIPEKEALAELRDGMYFSDGFFRFQNLRVLKKKGRSTFIEIELQEGKNREIRRLFARVGHKVIHLQRISFGPLRVGQLEIGKCRELRSQELKELYDFIRQAPHSRSVGKPRRKPRDAAKKKFASGGKKSTSEKSPAKETGSRRGAGRYSPVKKGAVKKSAAKKKSVKKRPAAGKKKGGRRGK